LGKITIDQSIKFLEFGFSNYSKLSGSKSKFIINKIYYSQQNTLVVEHITMKKDPMDIKIELGEIISFIGSFYLSETTEGLEYETPLFFAAMALNEKKDKLIYAVSSHDSARNIMKGNSIEWLKNTIFEDQTSDFLLTQAKLKISKIENALREIIYHILENEKSENWFLSIDLKIYKDAYSAFKKTTNNDNKSNSKILNYTYLPQLKTIIENNWNLFEIIFDDKNKFIHFMNDLNKIRRDESHNRKITEITLKKLSDIYEFIMSCIAKMNPEIIPHYIIENWHNSLFKIVEKLNTSLPNIDEKDRNNINKTLAAMKKYNNAVSSAVKALKELICPPNKKKLHYNLLNILNDLDIILNNMIKHGENLNICGLENEFANYTFKMNELNKFQEEYLLSEL
jgi:hypothetical protein